MSEKNTSPKMAQPEDEALKKVKGFWNKYSKLIMYGGTAIIILLGAYVGYKYFYKVPREEKAKNLIFPAEKIFDDMAANTSFGKDSVSLVLNGGNDAGNKVTGLLKIAKDYDGTLAANRAQYIIGACYLHLKEFDKAIKYLKEFDGNGADQVQSKAYLMLGHAYAEQNKKEEALNYYKKAANVNTKDDAVTPDALMIAAMYAEAISKSKEAIDLYKKIKDEYPLSQFSKSGEVDKHLARLGITN